MQSTTSSTRTFSTPPVRSEEPKPSKLPRQRSLINKRSAPWLAVLVLLIVSLFLFAQYHQAQAKLQSSSQQDAALVKQLGKIVLLPSSETPTIANVNDASKAKQQSAFFANAEDGDKVIVYNNEHQVILYRPSAGKIINFSTSLKITTSGSSNGTSQ
jgi:hypothetical protein